MDTQTDDSKTTSDTQQRDIPSVTKPNKYIKFVAFGAVMLSLGALALNMENTANSSLIKADDVDENYGTGIIGIRNKDELARESKAKSTTGYVQNKGSDTTNNYYYNDNTRVNNESPNGITERKWGQAPSESTPRARQQTSEVANLERQIKDLKQKQKWERRAKSNTTIYEAGNVKSSSSNSHRQGNELDQLLSQESQLREQLNMMGQNQVNGMIPNPNTGSSNQNANSAFGQQVNSQIVETAMAMPMGSLEYKITQGKMIPCTLDNAIDSSLPGMVRCIISRNVYGETGRNILIPRGAKVVGQYNSSIVQGQYRIYTMWTRIITSTYDINIGSPGSDSLGRAGSAGEVDTHFWKKFGNATLLSFIGAGASNYGVEGGDQYNSSSAYRQQIASQFSTQANDSLQDGLKIPDTIHKDQGEKITIMAAKDLDFSLLMHQQAAQL